MEDFFFLLSGFLAFCLIYAWEFASGKCSILISNYYDYFIYLVLRHEEWMKLRNSKAQNCFLSPPNSTKSSNCASCPFRLLYLGEISKKNSHKKGFFCFTSYQGCLIINSLFFSFPRPSLADSFLISFSPLSFPAWINRLFPPQNAHESDRAREKTG